MEKTRPDTVKRKKEEAHGDEKIHPTKEDLFDKGQSLRDSDDEGIVVTPQNPESQEWHAREDVREERNNP